MLSQIIIVMTPNVIPNKTISTLDISNASGIRLKHTTAIISPAANSNMKLRNLLDFFLRFIPIYPPSAVPTVPKSNPRIVVFNMLNIN
jgi:hypothetical protein